MDFYTKAESLELSGKNIDVLVNGLLEGKLLEDLHLLMDKRVSEKDIYAILSMYCREILGEEICEISPKISTQRLQMLRREKAKHDYKNALKAERKILSEVLQDLILLSNELLTESRV